MHEKIKAAEMWGFKKVIIPAKNYQYSIDPKDYKIEVIPAKTLEDYLRECLVQEKPIQIATRSRSKRKFQ